MDSPFVDGNPHQGQKGSRGTFFLPPMFLLAAMVLADEALGLRTWHDTSGKFEVQAAFVGAKHDTATQETLVTLRKADGMTVVVPLSRLSEMDRAEVQRATKASPPPGEARPKGDARRRAGSLTATSERKGFAKYFFDGKEIGTGWSWERFTDQPPPPTPPWLFGVIDRHHLLLILGTGVGEPVTVKSVAVWQKHGDDNQRF